MKQKFLVILTVIFVSVLFINLIYAKSLWVDSGELFLDRKLLQEGDAITILFNNNTIVKYKTETESTANSTITPASSSMMSFLPSVDYFSDSTHTKNVDTTSEGSIEGSITVEVLSITNNNLIIGGQHTIFVNGDSESVSISALAPQRRIKRGSMIYSTDLINPTIIYKGLTVSKSTNFTPENVIITTNEAGVPTVDFTDEEKNKIIIDFLNKSLQSLFSY